MPIPINETIIPKIKLYGKYVRVMLPIPLGTVIPISPLYENTFKGLSP